MTVYGKKPVNQVSSHSDETGLVSAVQTAWPQLDTTISRVEAERGPARKKLRRVESQSPKALAAAEPVETSVATQTCSEPTQRAVSCFGAKPRRLIEKSNIFTRSKNQKFQNNCDSINLAMQREQELKRTPAFDPFMKGHTTRQNKSAPTGHPGHPTTKLPVFFDDHKRLMCPRELAPCTSMVSDGGSSIASRGEPSERSVSSSRSNLAYLRKNGKTPGGLRSLSVQQLTSSSKTRSGGTATAQACMIESDSQRDLFFPQQNNNRSMNRLTKKAVQPSISEVGVELADLGA